MAATRGSIENDRFQRLNKLKSVTERFQGFGMDEKRFVAERLSNVSLSQEGAADQDSIPIFPEQEPPPPILQEQVPPILQEQQELPIPQEQKPPILDQEQEPLPLPVYPISPTTADSSLSLDQTFRTFESLSLDFKANVAKLASVAPSEPLLSSSDEEVRDYRVMTKAQNQLTTDEGKVWGKIATSMSMYAKPSASTASLDFPISTINDIHTLADKSLVMSTSFLRRTDVPTDQTYLESKEILQAMGIPCIDAAGATEAEALASAIVHQGLADFVATEDTVRKTISKIILSSRILY